MIIYIANGGLSLWLLGIFAVVLFSSEFILDLSFTLSKMSINLSISFRFSGARSLGQLSEQG